MTLSEFAAAQDDRDRIEDYGFVAYLSSEGDVWLHPSHHEWPSSLHGQSFAFGDVYQALAFCQGFAAGQELAAKIKRNGSAAPVCS